MINHLASKKLSAYLLLLFLAIVSFNTLSTSQDVRPLFLSLFLILLNLLASVYVNFKSLKKREGLLLFHICLILIICFAGWGRLVFFKGYFELTEEELFSGNFISSKNGPLYNKDRLNFRLSRGEITNGSSLLHFIEDDREKETILLKEGYPASYKGYNFFLQPKNHGLTLTFKDKREDWKSKTFSINLPLTMPRANEISIEGLEKRVKLILVLENYDLKKHRAKVPENTKVSLTIEGEETVLVKKGESVDFKGHKLTLEEVRTWDGISVTYDPGAFYMALAALIAALAILWHFISVNFKAFKFASIGLFFKNQNALVTSLLILLIFATFWQVYSFDFVWDDSGDIIKNPNYNPVTFENILNFWKAPFMHLYIPFTYTLWGALAFLSRFFSLTTEYNGLHPALFHLFNLFVHSLNVLFVYNIIKIILKVWEDKRKQQEGIENYREPFNLNIEWTSGIGALLFAIHPMQVESVAWIDELRGLSGAFFTFLAVYLYLKNRNILYIALSFLFALFSKPSTVTLPLIILIFDCFILNRPLKKTLPLFLFLGSISLIMIAVTRGSQPESMMKLITPLWQRPLVSLDALAFYIQKSAFPLRLGLDYGRTSETILKSGVIYFTWLIPFFMLLILGLIKKLRPLLIPFALFTVGVFPVLGLFPFVTQAISTVSDRYIYIAMLGPSLAVAWLLMKEKKTLFIFIPVLFIFGVKSSAQKWNWENEFVAFKNAVYINPESYIGHHYTGLSYLKQGKIKEADFHFSEMSRIKPSYESSPHTIPDEPYDYRESTAKNKTVQLDKKLAVDYNELGNSLMSISNFKLAVEKYKMALRIAPEMGHIQNNLATALHALKRDKEALEAVYKSLKTDPGFIEAYLNLAIILGDLGRYDEAEEVLEGALKISPQEAEIYNNLGIVLVENGKIEEGLQSFREALKIDPKYEEAIENIGYVEIFKKSKPTENSGDDKYIKMRLN